MRDVRYSGSPMLLEPGCEWIVDAQGCDPALLRSIEVLSALFDRAMRELKHRGGAYNAPRVS